MEEYKIEVIYTATGTTERPNGQQAGVPAHDIRVTHLPTGLMAQCGDARSQHKNKLVAMSMLDWGLSELGYNISKATGGE